MCIGWCAKLKCDQKIGTEGVLELVVLDLSSNSLSGPIPTCLGEVNFLLNSITYTNIDYEGYQEDSLDNFIYHKQHPTLDAFEGTYKVIFTTKRRTYSYKGQMLFYISGIDMSCNLLTGQIPHQLGNLTSLNALNLSHNRLWGTIPDMLSNMQSIESLDLSYNNLNGSIPSALTTLNTLAVFNVSHNSLSGRIPIEAQFSTFDNSSYQGNPLLCGPPLSKNCATGESPSVVDGSASKDGETWIDMRTFYMTFMISGATMFLAVVIMLLVVNPFWLNVLFDLVKACITMTYYFTQDSVRRLREAVQV